MQSNASHQSSATIETDAAQTTQNTVWTMIVAFVGSLAAMGIFAVIAFSFGRGVFLRLDQRALWSAFEVRELDAWLSPMMAAASDLGSIIGLLVQAAIALGLILWRKPQGWMNEGLRFMITAVGAMLLFVLIKNQIARPRPSMYPSPYHFTTYSFPSGHSLSSSAFYGGIVQLFAPLLTRRGQRWLLVLGCAALVMLIGFSRMYFSVHYPTDVMGGFIGGIAWLFVLQSVWQGIAWRRTRRLQPR